MRHSRLGTGRIRVHVFAMTERSSDPAPEKPRKRETARAKVPAEPKSGQAKPHAPTVEEIGGRDGPDPTRYGDYEKNGRCVDF